MKIIQSTLKKYRKKSQMSQKKFGKPPKSKVGRVSGNPSLLWQQTHIGAKPPIKIINRHFGSEKAGKETLFFCLM